MKCLLPVLLCTTLAAAPLLSLAQNTTTSITGRVVDNKKQPLVGVSVRVDGTINGTMTGMDGRFTLRVQDGNSAKITLSFLGLKSLTLPVGERPAGEWVITMASDEHALDEVVVSTGIISRNRLGFTGAITVVNREDLKAVGNSNVLQSLKSIDPGFAIIENNLAGSDPNAMLNIEVRGQTTMNITNVANEAAVASNQPLFILDGFEVSLQEIYDLDINRVASITLLKDAGSTAIYGSKGANGVVVVETVKPRPGELFVSYTGDFQLAMPDLSVYNMMNAAEKLEFERLAGRYSYGGNEQYPVDVPMLGSESGALQARYYERLAWVKEGVDTYWLSEPVRTAFTQGHSVTVSSGENALLFTAGLNYRSTPGVMKGSERDTYGGNIRIVYRGFDGLSIFNSTMVQGTEAQNGSWGKFSDFVNANPYFRKTDAEGNIPRYLDYYTTASGAISYSANPLYNAMLNSRNDNSIFNFTNNTGIEYAPTKNLMFKANVSLKRSTSDGVNFVDPQHTSFTDTPYDQKGTYTSSKNTITSYDIDAQVNYLLTLGKHNLTFIARGSLQNRHSELEASTYVGFPEGAVGSPNQSYSYKPDAGPSYSDRLTRSVSLIGAFNYNYNYRYLLDLNYNVDGSTNFGSNRRYQGFWSVGAGWNISREPFAEDWTWMQELKLRATFGNNGNQSVNANTSSIYTYYVGNNWFGQSSYLSTVGNPNLDWQVVQKMAGGVDVALLRSNLRISADIYRHYTDPLTVRLAQKPSTGVSDFAANMGHLTTIGYEFKVSYNIINNVQDKILLNVRATGGFNTSTYGGFNDALRALNEQNVQQSNINISSLASLVRYQDGYSPADIWAVRSLGIDPSTGRELFLAKDGRQTYDYNPEDRVVIASTRPDIEGILGFSIRYKKISLNANLRYSMGAYVYNTALFNKVENISSQSAIYNQDKRALYDRWKQPGDVAQFKKIGLNTKTPSSSRFIQKHDFLRGESAKLTWDFTGDAWLKYIKLKDFSINISVSDIFQAESIRIERGIDYPFQRAVLMGLSARF